MSNQGLRYFEKKRALSGPVYSIDVEVVAIGKTHATSDRYPAKVALVDSSGSIVFNDTIKIPENRKIVSYLTPISGIRPEDYSNGNHRTLDETRDILKQNLPQDSILVGQNVQIDIDWLQLQQGIDFADHIELSEIFCSFNPKFGNMSYHSLAHEANVVLGLNVDSSQDHDCAKDAKYCVQLWEKALDNPGLIPVWQKQLVIRRAATSIVRKYCGKIDGVCISKFYRKFCTCGQPCG